MSARTLRDTTAITDSPVTRSLFGNTRWAWLWLLMRLYLGYTWLASGLGKIGNPAWGGAGTSPEGLGGRAVLTPEAPPRPPIAFDWYRAFIQSLLDAEA